MTRIPRREYQYRDYLSPFTNRYGGEKMRTIWSEEHKRLLWRKVWCALAKYQRGLGFVSDEELLDIEAHRDTLDIVASMRIEGRVHHDVVAELLVFQDQCKTGGNKIHLGATSSDIVDNADAIRMRDSLSVLLESLEGLMGALAVRVREWRDMPVLGYTHLQRAAPTTLGYRLAQYLQDLTESHQKMCVTRYLACKGKAWTGPVGTSAGIMYQLAAEPCMGLFDEAAASLRKELGIGCWMVTTQTTPRKQYLEVMSALSSLAMSLHRMAWDFRQMKSPAVGVLSTLRKGISSSSMPYKVNPIAEEKVCSLTRQVASSYRVAWDNAALACLERSLDDSANTRSYLPEAFLAIDEALTTAQRFVDDCEYSGSALAAGDAQLYGHLLFTSLVARGMAYERAQLVVRKWCSGNVKVAHAMLEFITAEEFRGIQNDAWFTGLAPVLSEAIAKKTLTYLDELKLRQRSIPARTNRGYSRG